MGGLSIFAMICSLKSFLMQGSDLCFFPGPMDSLVCCVWTWLVIEMLGQAVRIQTEEQTFGFNESWLFIKARTQSKGTEEYLGSDGFKELKFDIIRRKKANRGCAGIERTRGKEVLRNVDIDEALLKNGDKTRKKETRKSLTNVT